MSVPGQAQLAALLVDQAHHRAQILGRAAATLRIGHDRAGQTGQLVDLLLHRDAVDEVDEADHAGDFRNDRMRMRIPLRDRLAGLDRRAVA